MGWLKQIATGNFTAPGQKNDPLWGGQAGVAAEKASALQIEQAKRALQAQIDASKQIRDDLSPFREAGAEAMPLLAGAINDPSDRVMSNPFFQAMAAEQEQRLMASASARGKLGSGGTNDDLQRNLLLLGNQFAQQDIGSLTNLSTIGQNSAALTGAQTQQGANNLTGIMGQLGNAQAAGAVGQANAQAQGASNAMSLIGTAASIYFSDERLKENIQYSHTIDHEKVIGGIDIHTWDWTDEAKWIVGDQQTEGPIAQELMKTNPEMVITDPETGYLQVVM